MFYFKKNVIKFVQNVSLSNNLPSENLLALPGVFYGPR